MRVTESEALFTQIHQDAVTTRAGTGYGVPSAAQCALNSCAGGHCGLSPDRHLAARDRNNAHFQRTRSQEQSPTLFKQPPDCHRGLVGGPPNANPS